MQFAWSIHMKRRITGRLTRSALHWSVKLNSVELNSSEQLDWTRTTDKHVILQPIGTVQLERLVIEEAKAAAFESILFIIF